MTSAPTRRHILALYKSLLRESEKFANYNFRSYALRRIRDGFRDSKGITDPKLVKKQFDLGAESLETIRRQIVVGSLYQTEKLVIENLSNE